MKDLVRILRIHDFFKNNARSLISKFKEISSRKEWELEYPGNDPLILMADESGDVVKMFLESFNYSCIEKIYNNYFLIASHRNHIIKFIRNTEKIRYLKNFLKNIEQYKSILKRAIDAREFFVSDIFLINLTNYLRKKFFNFYSVYNFKNNLQQDDSIDQSKQRFRLFQFYSEQSMKHEILEEVNFLFDMYDALSQNNIKEAFRIMSDDSIKEIIETKITELKNGTVNKMILELYVVKK